MSLQRKSPIGRGKPLTNKSAMGRGKRLAPGAGLARSQSLARTKPLSTAGAAPMKGPSFTGRTRAPLERKTIERKPVDLQKVRQKQARDRERRAARPPKKRTGPTITAAEKACREIVAARSRGICERCGFGAAGLEKAHRVARSQGGKWAASNILDLCSPCHHDDHMNPAEAYAAGLHLRSHQNPAEEPVLWCKGASTGWAYLYDDGTWTWTDEPAAA